MTTYPSSLAGNGRIFYAMLGVLFFERNTTKTGGTENPNTFTVLHGVQSVGINTSVSRSEYPDYGRFQKEYGSYTKPEFEITIERVIDGKNGATFFYQPTATSGYQEMHLLNPDNLGADGFQDALKNYDITLVMGANQAYLGVSDDNPADSVRDMFSDAGTSLNTSPTVGGPAPSKVDSLNSYSVWSTMPNNETVSTCHDVTYRCCVLRSVSYNLSVEGAMTESLTFTTSIMTKNEGGSDINSYPEFHSTVDDAGTLRRRNVITEHWRYPKEVERAFRWTNRVRDASLDEHKDRSSVPLLGLQSVTIDVSIDYTELFDLGEFGDARGVRAKTNLMKQVALPINVSTSYTGIISDLYYGDLAKLTGNATDWKATDTNFSMADGDETRGIEKYKVGEEIAIYLKGNKATVGGTNYWYNLLMGKKNYLVDFGLSGGDTGGGNMECTLVYQNAMGDFAPKTHTAKIDNPTATDIY